ncbi:MAG: hypothetical protein L6R41_002489, partial [Letrouitia leprolyta]
MLIITANQIIQLRVKAARIWDRRFGFKVNVLSRKPRSTRPGLCRRTNLLRATPTIPNRLPRALSGTT